MSHLSLYMDFDFSPPVVVMVDDDPEYGRFESILGPAGSETAKDRVPGALQQKYESLLEEWRSQCDQDAAERLEREHLYRLMVFSETMQ